MYIYIHIYIYVYTYHLYITYELIIYTDLEFSDHVKRTPEVAPGPLFVAKLCHISWLKFLELLFDVVSTSTAYKHPAIQ